VEELRGHGGFDEPAAQETMVRGWHVEGLAVLPDMMDMYRYWTELCLAGEINEMLLAGTRLPSSRPGGVTK
jgi:hypothetical protein